MQPTIISVFNNKTGLSIQCNKNILNDIQLTFTEGISLFPNIKSLEDIYFEYDAPAVPSITAVNHHFSFYPSDGAPAKSE